MVKLLIIGGNMNNKVNDRNIEKKENDVKRPIYVLFYILILVLVSIAYASLAINYGVKTNIPNIIEPDNTPKPTPEKKEIPTSTPTPAPEPIPVIIPDNVDWKIQFENIVIKDGSINAVSPATISSSKTEVNYEVILSEPGDYYGFDVNVANHGNVDAKIYNIIEKTISERQMKYLNYIVSYKDGTEIKVGDSLNAGETKTITVFIKFKDDDITAEDLPDTAQDLKLSYQMLYIEK